MRIGGIEKRRTLMIERAIAIAQLFEEKGDRGVCYEDVDEIFDGACRRTTYRWLNAAEYVLRLERFKRGARVYFRRQRRRDAA